MIIIRVVDTETTGLLPDCKVVEIATQDLVLDAVGSGWRKGRTWSTLVNPGVPIPPEASAVHHITDDMVRNAPPIDHVMSGLLGSDPNDAIYFAAHEVKFDRAVLKLDESTAKWICTRKCAVSLWPEAPNYKNQTLRYYLGLKLSDPESAIPHRAAGDVYVTAALLRRMLAVRLTDGTHVDPDLLMQISAAPVLLPRLAFGKHAMKPCKDIPVDYWEWALKNITEDEDVQFTARSYIADHRTRSRGRSPV